MRVLYDYQAFDLQSHGGVSRCMLELYRNLPCTVHASLGVLESDNVYLQQQGYEAMGTMYRRFMGIDAFKGKRRIFSPCFKIRYGFDYFGDRNRHYSIKLLHKGEFDVFHPTFFDDYFLSYLKGKPFVLTIHDMIPELYPQYYAKDDFQIVKKKELATLAAHIVVPSNQTKNDIIRLLGISEEKITVIYHGCDEYISLESNLETKMENRPYLLYVGSRGAYKNFEYFIQSCVSILGKYKDLVVICVGDPFNTLEKQMFEQFRITGRIESRVLITDAELAGLYRHAVAFVFPSLYEGFGLPILECYKADGLLILNDASCFPEIAADAALFFSMGEKGRTLTDIIDYAMTMSETDRKKQLEKQRKRLRSFSWKQSADRLANIYKEVVESCGVIS